MEGDIVRKGIAEILGEAAKEKKNENKVAVLTMNDSPQLRKMIKYILDPEVVWWDMLKGTPAPYNPNKYLDAEGRLFQEIRLIYMFVESGDDWIGLKQDQYLTRMGLQKNPRKRERIWIQLLESITPEDALLLCAAPQKQFPFKGLTRKIIDEAFPGLLSPENLSNGQVVPPPILADQMEPAHGIPPQIANPVEVDIDEILK